MLAYITPAFYYVTMDQFFWISMAFTTIIGIYVSAAIYDGETREIKKFLIGLGAYATLIFITTCGRVFPQIINTIPRAQSHMPFASMITIFLVTTFYLIGMIIGIYITKYAHKGGGVHGK
jgi:hypothetical protein